MKAAIYLCGNGPYREPRMIEMQHLRIIRYIDELRYQTNSRIEIVDTYVDLNSRRSNFFQDLPGLHQLISDIKNKNIDAVVLDMKLDEKFGSGKYYPILNTLVKTELDIYNCYYDENNVMLTKLKRKYGNKMYDDYLPDDAEEFVSLFPTLAANIAYEVIKSRLKNASVEDLKYIMDDIEFLRNKNPYGSSSLPWLSDETKIKLNEIRNNELAERRKVEELFIIDPRDEGILWEDQLLYDMRNKDEWEWVRNRLVDIGFNYSVHDRKHSFTIDYGKYIIYVDPRVANSIKVLVYGGENIEYYGVGSFKIPDYWKNGLYDKLINRVDLLLD